MDMSENVLRNKRSLIATNRKGTVSNMNKTFKCPQCKKNIKEYNIISLATWWGDDYLKCPECGCEDKWSKFEEVKKNESSRVRR